MPRPKRKKKPRQEEAAPPARRNPALAWAAVFAVLAALHLTNVSSELGGNLGGDNIIYYLLAKALAGGKGYVDLYLPGHPPHLKFPFLFPGLLAPCFAFSNPIPAMHVMVALFNAAAAVILGIWAGRRLASPWKGLVLALVFGTIPKIYLQSAHILSEPVYMFFCYLALLILPETNAATITTKSGKGTSLPEGGAGALTRTSFALLALSLLAAYFTRTAGLALAAASVLALVLSRSSILIRSRNLPAGAVLAGVFIIFAAAWLIRNRTLGGAGMVYLSEFVEGDPNRGFSVTGGLANVLPRALHNAGSYLPFLGDASFTPALYAPLPGGLSRVAGYVLAALVAGGIILELTRGQRLAELFFIFSLAIVLFWPFMEDRFLLPVIPLAVYYLIRMVEWSVERALGGRAAFPAFVITVALILSGNAFITANYINDRFEDDLEPRAPVEVKGFGPWSAPVINWAKYDVRAQSLDPAVVERFCHYIIMNRTAAALTPPGAVILGRKPMLTYFLSGRESVPLLFDPLPDRQWQYMEDRKVDYIVTGIAEDELRAIMERWPERFQTVAAIAPGEVRLIKVERRTGKP